MFWNNIKNIYHGLSALIAVLYYGFPGKQLTVIGVTGTDGKTTTTHLIHHILKRSGKKTAMISSVYAEIGEKQFDTGFHVTTSDAWITQKFLRQAVKAGDKYIVLEITSHGLAQNRVLGIPYAIGVLTNVTHEHLDYHKTFKRYLHTKEKLLLKAKKAVVNRDDASYSLLDSSLRGNDSKIITYSIKSNADVTPKKFTFTSPLPGEYNRYNCLAAIAATKAVGLKDVQIRNALKSFAGVKGRFEFVPNNIGIDVVIDFAHTPNAIEQVLRAVKPMTAGKLIHVFGSAGKRDQMKRPIMGEKSARFADYIILTEEDYRDEDVNAIIDEIAQGCIKQGAVEMGMKEQAKALTAEKVVLFRIPNRAEAIDFAIIRLARKGDLVILTGKAHEQSLCRGTVEYPWSEHKAVAQALKKRMVKKPL